MTFREMHRKVHLFMMDSGKSPQTYAEIYAEHRGGSDGAILVPTWLHSGAMWLLQWHGYTLVVSVAMIVTGFVRGFVMGIRPDYVGWIGACLAFWPFAYLKVAVLWPLFLAMFFWVREGWEFGVGCLLIWMGLSYWQGARYQRYHQQHKALDRIRKGSS